MTFRRVQASFVPAALAFLVDVVEVVGVARKVDDGLLVHLVRVELVVVLGVGVAGLLVQRLQIRLEVVEELFALEDDVRVLRLVVFAPRQVRLEMMEGGKKSGVGRSEGRESLALSLDDPLFDVESGCHGSLFPTEFFFDSQ